MDDGSGIAKTLASVKDSMNQSAIHIAATEGRVNICKYWINDLKLEVDVQDAKGTTPLHRAILGGHMSTSVYLLEKHLILILQMIMGTLHCAAEKGTLFTYQFNLHKILWNKLYGISTG
ncbi:N-terminal acetyltransferase A, auxiliary subunit [Thalictrum thalictroides]|uniref:N-terminal acetyltransferase A, auxiliary subunit n=1 Tax=Thalictrum thalictroides TaxID=46969 RepID=A0A7J6X5R6_THATH|nr:N-terminal acetyltransferase A, auxiliary subunit [Thalictrum thalictroides]